MTSRPRARSGAAVVDLLVVAVLLGAAVVGFGPVWGGTGYLVPAVGGITLGLGLAWLGAVRRWDVLALAASVIVVYLLAGGALALRSTTLFGLLPTTDTLRALLLGAVRSWKDLVTAATPVSSFPGSDVVPLLAALVAGVLSASLALRARRPYWALLPAGALLVGVVLLGSSQPAVPVAQGIVFAVTALGWHAWRRMQARTIAAIPTEQGRSAGASALRRRRLAGTATVLAVSAIATALSASALAPDTPRRVPRDVVVPPLDLHDYRSPLVAFRKYVKDQGDDVLFSVEGLPRGERLRLATLDAYTGTVMDVAGGSEASSSGTFARSGLTLPAAGDAPPAGEAVELKVTIGAYDGVWVPFSGQPTAIRFAGARGERHASALHYNSIGATALTTVGLAKGDAYTVTTTVADVPDLSDLDGAGFATVQLPTPLKVPESVGAMADDLTATATEPVPLVEALRKGLAGNGVLTSGLVGEEPSRAGHGSDRIDTLLSLEPMAGDDEQFAVAMALMARQLGIPARVVMGFYPDEDEAPAGSTYQVHGDDVHAWVEVAFAGVGWVPVDAAPDEGNVPPDDLGTPQSKPQPPRIDEPPPAEEPDEVASPPVPTASDRNDRMESAIDWAGYLRLAAAVILPLMVLGGPPLLVLLAKAQRRTRRRREGPLADRMSGGWSEFLDTAQDMRVPVRAGATRRENAAVLASVVTTARPAAMAIRADASVFGPGEPTADEVDHYWRDVDTAVAELGKSVGWWTRTRARFSLWSLRGVRRPALTLTSDADGAVAPRPRPMPWRDAATPAAPPAVAQGVPPTGELPAWARLEPALPASIAPGNPHADHERGGVGHAPPEGNVEGGDVEHTRLVGERVDSPPVGSRAVRQIRLLLDDGAVIVVSGTGLLGRNPAPDVGESVSQVVPLDDPGRSVSKTHLAFGADDGGGLWVADRHSVNGTVVVRPDGSRTQLEPGVRTRVPAGAVVELGTRRLRVEAL